MEAFRALESSPVPLYAQIKEILRERIVDGTYPAHARLPAESEMISLFGVSRITVRQALSDLEREGVIFKVPGKGTFVAQAKAYQQLAQLEGFGEAMARAGHEILNKVISHRQTAAGQEVAQQLKLAAEAPVTEITRVRHLDGKPVSLEVTWLPQAVGERLRGEDLVRRDIFVILESDYGIALGHADIQIDAVPADSALAEALRVPEGSALLRLQRLTFTADGEPIDFEYLHFRSDIFQYRMRLARRAVGARISALR